MGGLFVTSSAGSISIKYGGAVFSTDDEVTAWCTSQTWTSQSSEACAASAYALSVAIRFRHTSAS